MSVNLEVVAEGSQGLSDQLIKKFLKKFKKMGIMEEYLSKTSFAMTRTQKQREKRRKNAHKRRALERKRQRNRRY